VTVSSENDLAKDNLIFGQSVKPFFLGSRDMIQVLLCQQTKTLDNPSHFIRFSVFAFDLLGWMVVRLLDRISCALLYIAFIAGSDEVALLGTPAR